MKKKTGFMFAAMLLAAGTAGCGSMAKEEKTIRIGVRDDIMNFGYLNETTGKYYGLEIDLANEIAEMLGYDEIEFVTVQPETRKEMLLAGEVDCLIACYSIADTRLENFDFSPAYYTDYIRVMVEKSSCIVKQEDLLGKTIGVLDGANAGVLFGIDMVAHGYVEEDPDFSVSTYDDGFRYYEASRYQELDEKLEDGTVDAVCMDGTIAESYMNDERMLLPELFAEQQYGIATQKGSELSAQIAEAVQTLLDNGRIAELTDKWD